MKIILMTFAKEALKMAVGFFGICLVLALLLFSFGLGKASPFVALIFYAVPLLATVANSQNTMWLRHMPITRQMLLLTFIGNTFVSLVFMALFAAAYLGILIFAGDQFHPFSSNESSPAADTFFSWLKITQYTGGGVLGIFTFAALLSSGRLVAAQQATPWKSFDLRQWAAVAAGFFGGVLLIILDLTEALGGAIIFLTGFISLPAVCFYAATRQLGLPKFYQKRWTIGAGSMGLLVSAATLIAAYADLNNRESELVRYEAQKYLGFLSGSSRRSILLEAIQQDLPAKELDSAVKLLVPDKSSIFSLDAKWYSYSEAKDQLSFAKAISKKNSHESASFLFYIYDPRKLTESDFEAYISRLPSLNKGIAGSAFPANYWAYQNFDDDRLKALLKSNNSEQADIALAYLRFHPSPQSLGLIVKNFESLPESLFIPARNTMETVIGRPLSFPEMAKLVSQKTSHENKKYDCSGFKIEILGASDYFRFKACLRKMALRRDYPTLAYVDGLPRDKKDLTEGKISKLKELFSKRQPASTKTAGR